MERELCLVLDTKGEYRLKLLTGTKQEIDEYTSKFEDSEAIRNKHLDRINVYLEQYKESLEKSNNPSYKGRIVVVDPKYVGMEITKYQKKTLFKKHIVSFKELIKSQNAMTSFCSYELKKENNCYISKYFSDMIKRYWMKKGTKTEINRWLKEEKEKGNYYEIVRDLLNSYEIQRTKNEKLPSCDEIYKQYLTEKAERISKIKKTKLYKTNHTLIKDSVVIDDSPQYFTVNGNKYTIDELHLLDLEDIKSDSDYIPDGLGYIR